MRRRIKWPPLAPNNSLTSIRCLGGAEPGTDRSPEPVHVLFVVPESPASKDGKLRCGDRLLAVDGHSLECVPHSSAVSMLKQTSTRVVLEVVSWMGTELWTCQWKLYIQPHYYILRNLQWLLQTLISRLRNHMINSKFYQRSVGENNFHHIVLDKLPTILFFLRMENKGIRNPLSEYFNIAVL